MITPETGGIRLDLDQRVYLRVMARFFSTYAVFPRGYGKCVRGDTLIFTEDGVKEIGSLFDYNVSGNETFYTSDVKIANRYGNLEGTNAGVYSGYLPTKRITTEEGFFIEGTHHHPILTMKPNGKIEWTNLEDIKLGDFVAISRGSNVWGSKTKLYIDMDSYMEALSNQSRSHIKPINIIDELDDEFGLIIGYLVGDGTMTRDDMIGFTTKDDDILKNYKNFMEGRLGLTVRQKTSGIDYEVSSKYAREYFRQIGLDLVDASGKQVPKSIMSAPKSIVANFIKGLFDTDGGISNSYIEYCTISEKLARQVQTLLLNFGIVSTLRKKATKCSDAYIITIYGKNMDIFLRDIGFSCKRKQDKLILLCKKKRNTNKDIIPFQKDIVSRFVATFGNKKPVRYADSGKPLYVKDVLYHVVNGNNELTYERLEYVLSLDGAQVADGYEELLEILKTNYFFSAVSDVSDGVEHVYDLSVPGTHSFISNGIISHNTMLEVMAMIHAAIFFPNLEISMTAQTKENAVSILEDKWRELLRFYPMLKNEVDGKEKFAKDSAEIKFKSGGRIDILANNQSTKGQRRRRLMIEEAALLDDKTFQDALKPVVNVSRRTLGKSSIDPHEMNGQINFLTTSGKLIAPLRRNA